MIMMDTNGTMLAADMVDAAAAAAMSKPALSGQSTNLPAADPSTSPGVSSTAPIPVSTTPIVIEGSPPPSMPDAARTQSSGSKEPATQVPVSNTAGAAPVVSMTSNPQAMQAIQSLDMPLAPVAQISSAPLTQMPSTPLTQTETHTLPSPSQPAALADRATSLPGMDAAKLAAPIKAASLSLANGAPYTQHDVPPPTATSGSPVPSPGAHGSPGGPLSHATTPLTEGGIILPSAHQLNSMEDSYPPSEIAPYKANSLASGGGYHLPDSTDAKISPEEYADQCNCLYALVRDMHPSAVRRVIRDTWQTSLAESEAHVSFVMNVVLHNCSTSSAQAAIKNFGGGMVQRTAKEVMEHFSPALLQEVEDTVVDRAPDTLLDKCMSKRLNTISGKTLLNMLARAERLGYDAEDIVDDTPAKRSTAIPLVPAPAPAPTPTPASTPAHDRFGSDPSTRTAQDYSERTTCPNCRRRFDSTFTRDHHVRKKLCLKGPPATPWMCRQCDQAFLTPTGLNYHIRHNVCGGHVPPPSTSASPVLLASPGYYIPASHGSPHPPSTQRSLAQKPPPTQQYSSAPPTQRPLGRKFPPTQQYSSAQHHPSTQQYPSTQHHSSTQYHPSTQQHRSSQPPLTQPQHASQTPPGATKFSGNVPKTSSTATRPHLGSPVTPVYPPRPTQSTSTSRPAPATPVEPVAASPSPYAHLSEAQRALMDQELEQAEVAYSKKMRDADTVAHPDIRKQRLDSLKNSFATKQSIIRKKYGVRLRERRSRATIEDERRRMRGEPPLQHSQTPSPRQPRPRSSYDHAAEGQASKKARVGMGGQSVTTQSHPIQNPPPRKHVTSADVAAPVGGGGLMAVEATPETTDPTKAGGPPHPGRPASQAPTTAAATRPSNVSTNLPRQPTAIVAIPVSDSDSDSDSDVDEIPAQLPPPPPRADRKLVG